MKAVTCHHTQLELVDLPDPRPGRGQVMLEVLRCGICGSDLHARHYSDQLADVLTEAGYPDFMRVGHSVVFGHEFSGTVAEYGPSCRKQIAQGSPVVKLDPTPLHTGTVGLGGVENAFTALADPDIHAKILIDPHSPQDRP